MGARPPVCGWTFAAADDVWEADDEDVAAAVVLAAALLVGLAVVTAAVLAALLVVAAAELLAGADDVTAVVVAGAAEDVETAAVDEGAADEVDALEAVVVVVAAGVPQAASNDAPANPAAPLRANWMMWRRRNGAPVLACTSDIGALYLLDGDTTHTRVKGNAVRHKTAA